MRVWLPAWGWEDLDRSVCRLQELLAINGWHRTIGHAMTVGVLQVQAGRLGLPGVGKLLRLATELGLGDLKASVCRVQGHKALQVPLRASCWCGMAVCSRGGQSPCLQCKLHRGGGETIDYGISLMLTCDLL